MRPDRGAPILNVSESQGSWPSPVSGIASRQHTAANLLRLLRGDLFDIDAPGGAEDQDNPFASRSTVIPA